MYKNAIKTILEKIGLYRPSYFTSSSQYWEERYKKGGNSGIGSYNRLAAFKAEVINKFVKENDISRVIELGCGDGNQLKYFDLRSYVGYDISPTVIEHCRKMFQNDKNKTFKVLSFNKIREGGDVYETADLLLSLDVIYHLVEDTIFVEYMERLFHSSEKFVIIYSSNYDDIQIGKISHVRYRKFTDWIEKNAANFKLIEYIPNKYPSDKCASKDTSSADFYIFQKQEKT
jgi:SAM-dependent methyltransferase